jgi:hypothetical protein
MKKHNKRVINDLCTYLGENLDHPMCKELIRHVEECPECKFYIDTIKTTVNIFRETHPVKSLPDKVKKDLFKTLNISK